MPKKMLPEERLLGRIKTNHKAMLKKYGITEEVYQQMLIDSNGICPICDCKRTLHIDHNHQTGKVRGLICTSCNTGLGKFKDNIELLTNALKYLKRYK